MLLHTISNHPVHILNEGGKLSPSAFIPFCEFGGDMSILGIKIDQFDMPVCKSFEPKILNDQLCYEIDLSKFSKKDIINQQLAIGLTFLMDYNEDRQATLGNEPNIIERKKNLQNSIEEHHDNIEYTNEDDYASIYLDTIGKRFLDPIGSLDFT